MGSFLRSLSWQTWWDIWATPGVGILYGIAFIWVRLALEDRRKRKFNEIAKPLGWEERLPDPYTVTASEKAFFKTR